MKQDEAFALAMDAFSRGVYAKNIEYRYSPNADLNEFSFIRQTLGSPGQVSWITQQAYAKVGMQIQVQKDVSDDLLASDFAPASKFNDVPWPAQACEVYFEDPKLPTLLLFKTKTTDIPKLFPGIEVRLEADEYVSAILQEGTDLMAKTLSLQLKPDMYDRFLTESQTEHMERLSPLNSRLNPQDEASFAVLVRLALKVFAFASIPHLKPAPITRKEMHFGGKPEVKGRPRRPAFRCLYAPNVKYTYADREEAEEGSETGKKHEFRGRRGHFRYFSSERFVHVKNTWTFIRPVPGPDGTYPKVDVMKVRKPA